jgi:rhamnosyltransferase subunit B
MLTSGAFGSLASNEGFEFVEGLTAAEHAELEKDPQFWRTRRGAATFFRKVVLAQMRNAYEHVRSRHVPGQTVAVAPPWAIGVRIAQERLGIPLATVQLAPWLFRSAYINRRLPGFSIPDWIPPAAKRCVFRVGDFILDTKFGREINLFRAELGLPMARRMLTEWWLSPQRVLGLFPDWFAPPQPDWPSQIRLTGFLFYSPRQSRSLPDDVTSFLESGERPIAFTCGTGTAHQHEFFEVSVAACQALGRRGILITRFEDQVPERLPPYVRHFPFVPFDFLLPRIAALVHHGGIGTAAQALAAGIPQLVRPITYDQPDNAYRLERLGVAAVLTPRAYRPLFVAKTLGELLSSLQVQERTRQCAARLAESRALDMACDEIEQLGEVGK